MKFHLSLELVLMLAVGGLLIYTVVRERRAVDTGLSDFARRNLEATGGFYSDVM